jgi:hypothetical protein
MWKLKCMSRVKMSYGFWLKGVVLSKLGLRENCDYATVPFSLKNVSFEVVQEQPNIYY